MNENRSLFARIYFWLADRLYNEFAWAYDPVSWMVSLGQWDTIRKLSLEKLAGSQVLEIGFGTGELLIEMTRRGFQVTGLDLSMSMQHQVSKKLRKINLQIPRLCSRTQQVPIASGSFDSIVSTFPAGYILEQATWNECARLLRPVSSATPSRFIVIGLWIARVNKSRPAGDKIAAEPHWEAILGRFENLAHTAGLTLKVEMAEHDRWLLPILVAEKRDG